jgi:hypothetical protein
VNGPFSDEDIERVRELALIARAEKVSKAPPTARAPARKASARPAKAVKAVKAVPPAKAAPRKTRARA